MPTNFYFMWPGIFHNLDSRVTDKILWEEKNRERKKNMQGIICLYRRVWFRNISSDIIYQYIIILLRYFGYLNLHYQYMIWIRKAVFNFQSWVWMKYFETDWHVWRKDILQVMDMITIGFLWSEVKLRIFSFV